MSLFSRLERIREKAQEGDAKDSGMFGVADLGPGSESAPDAPAEPAAAPAAAPDAPEMAAEPVTVPSPPVVEPDPEPEPASRVTVPTPSIPMPASSAPSQPIESAYSSPEITSEEPPTRFVPPAAEVRATPPPTPEAIRPAAAPLVTPPAATAPTPPPAAAPPVTPIPAPVEESSGPSPFDRLMAARGQERSEAIEPVPAPQPPVPAPEPAGLENRIGRVTERASAITAQGQLARVEMDAASEREAKTRGYYRHKHLIFDSVLGSLDPRILQNPQKETVRPAIERSLDGALREYNLALDAAEHSWMVDEFLRETMDFGPLVPLLEDSSVNKILVTGSGDVTIEKLGRMERTGISFRDDDHLLSLIRRVAESVGGRIDSKVPLLDRPLPDGARIRAKIPPMSPQPNLTIEKTSGNPFVALKRQQAERGRGDLLPYAQLRERIQQRLVREFETDSLTLSNQERLRGQVEEMINNVIQEERVAVTRAERAALVMDLLNEIVGLGPIEPLLNDPEVDEVMVNGPYQIYVERKGKLELAPQRFRDNNHVMQVIERIVAPLGRRIDEKSPMVDGRLRDGSRFNAIIPPLALTGPTMTIRKFARDPFTMTDLINFGSLTRESAQFLQAVVEGRLNVVVSGGTGSGKTTTLNVLSSFIPASERIVTIEDAAELQLRQDHVIRLETRPPNIEGIGEITIRDLVRNALRMRPDRIVVGECRGGEALDMLQAMNTGHDGSLTTAHSNGPRDTLKRLETMVMMAGFDLPVRAIREQVTMAIQVIVHQERMRDGKRRVTAITEIVGMESDVITMQDIFRFEQERVDEEGRIIGSLVPTGLRPKNFDTILDNGVELSMDLFQPRSMMDGPQVRSRLAERMAVR